VVIQAYLYMVDMFWRVFSLIYGTFLGFCVHLYILLFPLPLKQFTCVAQQQTVTDKTHKARNNFHDVSPTAEQLNKLVVS